MANPKVFMDINIAGAPAGRIIFELFADTSPIAAENFRALCTGEKGIGKNSGKPLHYKGLSFDFIRNEYIFLEGNRESIYGEDFKCENFLRKLAEPGLLSMGLSGSSTPSQNSRFFITMSPLPRYDGICVVVGKVINGMDVVNAISKKDPKNVKGIIIADCGQLIDDDGRVTITDCGQLIDNDEDIEPY